jgi:hypothetical protein
VELFKAPTAKLWLIFNIIKLFFLCLNYYIDQNNYKHIILFLIKY